MERLTLESLQEQVYDVVVIGAGAVGCASARELAARGYRTLLVDRGDMCRNFITFKSYVVFWRRLSSTRFSFMANTFPIYS